MKVEQDEVLLVGPEPAKRRKNGQARGRGEEENPPRAAAISNLRAIQSEASPDESQIKKETKNCVSAVESLLDPETDAPKCGDHGGNNGVSTYQHPWIKRAPLLVSKEQDRGGPNQNRGQPNNNDSGDHKICKKSFFWIK